VKLFLDTSVILSACGSDRGASREIFRLALVQNWTLVATPYVIGEVLRNLDKVSPNAEAAWAGLRDNVVVEDDVVTLDRPTFFTTSKDRPILFGAVAWADVLLTVDKGDFEILGGTFYDLSVLEPGEFLDSERRAGNL
jgi:predicted nucleic acid-binding protein